MRISTHGLLLAVGALIWLTGCASIGPPEAPSLELPKPPSDLHASRKGQEVTLTWSLPSRTTDRQSVRYLGKTEVCRAISGPLTQCGTRIGESSPPADFAQQKKATAKKPGATFTDILPAALEHEHPTEFATYAVEALNAAGRAAGLSNQVRVPLVPTLPPFGDFVTKAVDQGILISWQCPGSQSPEKEIQYLFRIYRREETVARETKIADVEATKCATRTENNLVHSDSNSPKGKPAQSFLDDTFEWEKTYSYRGTVVSVIKTAGKPAVEVEGDNTPEVKIFAHDIFPPAVPTGIQAVFSGPGQQPFIDLIWTPVADADLDGYNVYRHQRNTAPMKINTELVKTPAFRDAQTVSGQTYFYSVSAVDQRGNESARSEETSEITP